MTELPSQGRNWMSLALLAPGNRTNAQGATPVQDRGDVREFQLNVDGLQVTSNLGTGNQSRYSNDAIAEFQFISNRFDATQGRSSGVQVNAITKSGTNTLSGIARRQLPRQRLERGRSGAEHASLPYSNQQISGTVGGPIVQNKLHFFANYEYEHQPLTSIWQTPYPAVQRRAERHQRRQAGGRPRRSRALVEDAPDGQGEPLGSCSSRSARATRNHPSGTNSNEEHSTDVIGQFTQVLSNRALNEFRAGYASYGINQVEPDVLVAPLAGAQRHHDRRSEHHVQGLLDRPEQQPAALSQSERRTRSTTTSRCPSTRPAVTT